jgi:DNA end-binding protein Ku
MLDNLPGKTSFSKGELAMATQLVKSMDETWKPKQYRDTYTDRINDLIEAKRKGNDVKVADEAPQPTNVVDLLEALRRSVDSARAGSGRATDSAAKKAPAKRASQTAAKKAPAKKAASKKTAAKEPPTRKTAATGQASRSPRKAS